MRVRALVGRRGTMAGRENEHRGKKRDGQKRYDNTIYGVRICEKY